MATTSIWKIDKRLDHVIEYTTNPDKTTKESYQELHNVIEYAKASYKTEEQLYVTTLNCSEETILQDMMETKKKYRKTNGILGFHGFQSFAEGEVTPEIAHEIGIKLANELWGDRFEVVVTTHVNTKHIHNHFCLNSVSFKDGKKYYNNRHTYALMRETSDRLCEEYKLSVIKEKPCGKYNIDYTKYYKEQVKKSNYHTIAKDDIDCAIGQAYSYKDFLAILNKMNYTIENRNGKLSIRKEHYKRNIRIERVFGDEYKIENIEKRIYETEKTREPFPEARIQPRRYKMLKKQDIRNRKKAKGIKALYFYYCFLFKIYPINNKQQYSKELREEIKKMDKISNEAKFLCKNNIQTVQELLSCKKSLTIDRQELKSKKENLWKKHKKAKSENEKQSIYAEIQIIQNEINELSKKIELIEDIETRVPKIKENIEELENDKKQRGKERENIEHIK